MQVYGYAHRGWYDRVKWQSLLHGISRSVGHAYFVTVLTLFCDTCGFDVTP